MSRETTVYVVVEQHKDLKIKAVFTEKYNATSYVSNTPSKNLVIYTSVLNPGNPANNLFNRDQPQIIPHNNFFNDDEDDPDPFKDFATIFKPPHQFS